MGPSPPSCTPVRHLAATVLAGCLALSPTPAAAQTSPASAEADRRFEEGKQLLRAERVAEACEAFAASDAIDPGIGVMMVLAACHEQLGRLASAHRAFEIAAARAQAVGDRREATARASAEALVPRIPSLVVRSAGPAAITASLDGDPIALGTVMRLDPGDHVLEARSPDRELVPLKLVLAPGERKEVVLTFDGPAKVSTVPREPETAPRRAGAPGGSTQRVLGWVAVGLGGAGLALGAGAGLSALGQKSDLEEDPACPDACRDEEAVDGYNGTRTVSTIGFLAGAAVLGAGIVLVITAPDGTGDAEAAALGGASTTIAVGPSSAVVQGRFW